MVFQPGQAANPGGRPKEGKIWKEALVRAIKRREETDPLALEKLADKLVSMAGNGDISAIKELADRLDGKASQTVDTNLNIERIPNLIIETTRSG